MLCRLLKVKEGTTYCSVTFLDAILYLLANMITYLWTLLDDDDYGFDAADIDRDNIADRLKQDAVSHTY